ncbi:MAG: ATP-binding protein [Verrucomicrobium sp.]|nr:ATP-binding protein [Verrucomicrobium sp.]
MAKARELVGALSGSTVLLLGDRGPGKTQIATWLANRRAVAKKSPGRYYRAVDLFGAIKATWSERTGTPDQGAIMERFRTVKFLVIDELNEALGTSWERQVFNNILDHRYGSMLTTLLIANLTEREAEEVLGPSIWTRACETGGVVICDWPSYRK